MIVIMHALGSRMLALSNRAFHSESLSNRENSLTTFVDIGENNGGLL